MTVAPAEVEKAVARLPPPDAFDFPLATTGRVMVEPAPVKRARSDALEVVEVTVSVLSKGLYVTL